MSGSLAAIGDDVDLAPGAWHGIYPGVVVSNDDPAKVGRLRVRVDQVYGATTESEFIANDKLPWARPCFPVTGDKSGCAWVPEPGAGVWITFWGGDPERPTWLGGWFPDAEVPVEFSGSYAGGPKTRLVRTANGHLFEMRWKDGEEHIHLRTAGGVDLDLIDSPALGGPKIIGSTPGGRKFYADDTLTKAGIETPTQKVVLDDAVSKILVQTPGTIEATAAVEAKVTVGATQVDLLPAAATVTAPTITATATALIQATAPVINMTTTTPTGGTFSMALLTFALAMTIAFAGALVLTGAALTATFAACVVTVTSLNVIGATINLGVLVNVKKLLNENYHTAIMLPHQHTVPSGTDAGGGITSGMSAYAGPFVAPLPATLAAAQTSNVKAS